MGKAHPRFVMRNRGGFHRADDTRDAGRERLRAQTNSPAASTHRTRAFRARLPSVERLANSLIHTCDATLRAVGAKRDPRRRTLCANWCKLVDNAKAKKQKNKNPRVAAALESRTKPRLVVGRDVVVIPLPPTGRLPSKLTVVRLVGTDKSEKSHRAFVETARKTICFPHQNVFCLSE